MAKITPDYVSKLGDPELVELRDTLRRVHDSRLSLSIPVYDVVEAFAVVQREAELRARGEPSELDQAVLKLGGTSDPGWDWDEVRGILGQYEGRIGEYAPGRASNSELVYDHYIVHAWWRATQSGRDFKYSKTTVQRLHGKIVAEMGRRGMKHDSPMGRSEEEESSELDRETQKALDEAQKILEETPNEIRYRIRSPGDFRPDTFRRTPVPGAAGVALIVGRLKPDKVPEGHNPNSMVAQALRFSKENWTMERARRWIAAHPNLTKGVDFLVLEGSDYKPLEKQEEDRFTLGIAYPVNEVDSHDEFAKERPLEQAAWWFARNGFETGHMHLDDEHGEAVGDVVETYIYRGPTWRINNEEVNKGDWLVGVIWKPEYWEKVKAGEIAGYSIHGTAAREPEPGGE